MVPRYLSANSVHKTQNKSFRFLCQAQHVGDTILISKIKQSVFAKFFTSIIALVSTQDIVSTATLHVDPLCLKRRIGWQSTTVTLMIII